MQFPDCLVGETSEALTEGKREIQVIRRVQKSSLKKKGDGYTIQTIYEAVIDGIALRRMDLHAHYRGGEMDPAIVGSHWYEYATRLEAVMKAQQEGKPPKRLLLWKSVAAEHELLHHIALFKHVAPGSKQKFALALARAMKPVYLPRGREFLALSDEAQEHMFFLGRGSLAICGGNGEPSADIALGIHRGTIDAPCTFCEHHVFGEGNGAGLGEIRLFAKMDCVLYTLSKSALMGIADVQGLLGAAEVEAIKVHADAKSRSRGFSVTYHDLEFGASVTRGAIGKISYSEEGCKNSQETFGSDLKFVRIVEGYAKCATSKHIYGAGQTFEIQSLSDIILPKNDSIWESERVESEVACSLLIITAPAGTNSGLCQMILKYEAEGKLSHFRSSLRTGSSVPVAARSLPFSSFNAEEQIVTCKITGSAGERFTEWIENDKNHPRLDEIDEQLRVLEVIVEDLLSAVNAHKLYAETSTGPGSKSSTRANDENYFSCKNGPPHGRCKNVGRHPIDKIHFVQDERNFTIVCCSCGTVAAKMQYRGEEFRKFNDEETPDRNHHGPVLDARFSMGHNMSTRIGSGSRSDGSRDSMVATARLAEQAYSRSDDRRTTQFYKDVQKKIVFQ